MINPQATSIDEAQASLDKHFPSPEEDLIELSQAIAYSPEGESYIEDRFLVLEIDLLIAQLRWHLGQVILVLRQFP